MVVGNITPARARDVIEKYFGEWKADGPKPPTDYRLCRKRSRVVAVPDQSRVQDLVILGQNIGITRSDADYTHSSWKRRPRRQLLLARLSIDLRKNAGLVLLCGL